MRALALVCLAPALAGCALAQNAPRVAPATSAYQPGIDVLDYDFRLTLPDTGALLRADVTVTARRDAGVRALTLDLVDNLTVRAVQVDGRDVASRREPNRIVVPLDAARGDTVRVRVRYDGVVTDGLVARKDARQRWTWFGDNWPDRARQWLATVDHPSDKATVTWTVRAPSGNRVVGNGSLVSTRALDRSDAGLTETRWRESHPIPTDVMVIAAGPLAPFTVPVSCDTTQAARCPAQTVYVLPENLDYLPGPFAAAPRIVALFEQLVGPFPYEKLSHLQSATRFGGMENASAIFYSYELFPRRRMTEGLIAHETAHQWFGDAVTEREWSDLWLSEGFATYFAALWTKQSRGEAAFRDEMRRIRAQILADSVVAQRPVHDSAQTNYLALLNANSYQKGGFILYMLTRRLGDSAFFGGLRAYYARHRDGNATSDDLRRALEGAAGQSLGAFFDQWLTRPGFAEPTVAWTYDAERGRVRLDVAQDSRFGAYEVPLTVLVRSATGDTSRVTVTLPAQRSATLELPGRFTARPASIVFDPDGELLGTVRQP